MGDDDATLRRDMFVHFSLSYYYECTSALLNSQLRDFGSKVSALRNYFSDNKSDCPGVEKASTKAIDVSCALFDLTRDIQPLPSNWLDALLPIGLQLLRKLESTYAAPYVAVAAS